MDLQLLFKIFKIKSMQCAAHGVQYKCSLYCNNNSPTAFTFAALSVTTCTTLSSPTNSTTSSSILKTLSVVFYMSEVSNEYIKTVPLGLFTKKLQIERLFLSVHPSDMIVQPVFFHSSLYSWSTKSVLSIACFNSFSLISYDKMEVYSQLHIFQSFHTSL